MFELVGDLYNKSIAPIPDLTVVQRKKCEDFYLFWGIG